MATTKTKRLCIVDLLLDAQPANESAHEGPPLT
jgi:hypothetical protein